MGNKKKIEQVAKPCINISVISCWNCKKDMIDSYYSDDLSIPVGPSCFTEKQTKIALEEGCIIKQSFSKTMQVSYPAAICQNCGSMHGDFFYNEYAYVPGDIQFFLNSKDNIIKKVVNKEIVLKQ